MEKSLYYTIFFQILIFVKSFIIVVSIHPPSEPFPLAKFLTGGPSCDIKIIPCESNSINFSIPTPTLPTTVVIVLDSKRQQVTTVLNVLQVRVAKCQLSLLFYKNIKFARQQSIFGYDSDQLQIATSSLHFNKMVIPYADVTLVLIVDSNSRTFPGAYDFTDTLSLVPKSFLVFPPDEDGAFSLCSMTTWMHLSLRDMICTKRLDEPLVGLNFVKATCSYTTRSLHEFESVPSNPFKNQPVIPEWAQIYLMWEALLSANVTPCKEWSDTGMTVYRTTYDSNTWRLENYPLSIMGNQFLTCYTKKYLSFEFYLTPFEADLWTGVALCFFLVLFSLTLYSGMIGIPFSPWLPLLATLFEETNSVPTVVERKQFFRLVFGTWALMVSLLTNCYNGIMTTNLNAPFPGEKVYFWKDIFCENVAPKNKSSIASWMITTGVNEYWQQVSDIQYRVKPRSMLGIGSEDCFQLLSNPHPYEIGAEGIPCNTLFYSLLYLWGRRPNIDLNEILLLSPKHTRELRDFSERNRSISNEQISKQIEKEVVKCGKTVFITKSTEIFSEYLYLSKKYYWKTFYLSKDMLSIQITGFVSKYASNSEVPRYLKSFVESGIWKRIHEEEWSMSIERRGRKAQIRPDKQKPVELDGSILTCFVMYGIMISLSLGNVGIELHWKILSNFARFLWLRLRIQIKRMAIL